MTQNDRIAVIAIGRNEGDRLIACLDSLGQSSVVPDQIIYVDSGSTDDSIAAAQARGAKVVLLDTTLPFTAARARNAGFAALTDPKPAFVQFLDGDCVLDNAWLDQARSFLQTRPKVAVACGRRREKYPEKTIYNRMCDDEWDTPVGQAKACGGDALMRVEAFDAVNGYHPSLIAGEEPEMCVRMRKAGWDIWRLDAEMTLHDADMTRFGQYWKRAQRCGHAFAEGAALHGAPPEHHYVADTRRALLWGAVLPALIFCLALIFGPWALGLALIYPAQVMRLALRDGGTKQAWTHALLLTASKFAESWGALGYYLRKYTGKQATLIEYK